VSFECRRAAPGKALSHRPQRSQEQCVVQHYSPSQDQVGADVAQLHGGGSKTWSENEGWSALLLSLLLSAGAGGCGRRARGVRVRVYVRACGEKGRAAGPGVRVGAWCRGPHASSSAPSVSLWSGTTIRNSVVVSSFLSREVCVVWACACGRRRRSSLNPHNRLGRCPTQSSHTRHQCTPTPRPPLGPGRPPSTPSAAALPGLCSVRLPPPRPRPTTPPPPAPSPRRT